MHGGLIVGIGPAATDFQYRTLIAWMAAVAAELELTMAHADTPALPANQAAGNSDGQVAIYDHLTRRLKAAGARSVAVTSIAGTPASACWEPAVSRCRSRTSPLTELRSRHRWAPT